MREEDLAKGRARGISLGSRETYVSTCKEFDLDPKETINRFANKFNVSIDEAEKAVKQYWG